MNIVLKCPILGATGMLRLTSCLFSTIVVHAYRAAPRTFRIDCYHHIFLAITVLSVLFHCTHDPIVRVIDKVCAHAGFLFVIFTDSWRIVQQERLWLSGFPIAVLGLWWAQGAWPARADALHAVLHVVAVIGIHCFIGFVADA
jgi:hypothetical protein